MMKQRYKIGKGGYAPDMRLSNVSGDLCQFRPERVRRTGQDKGVKRSRNRKPRPGR